MVMGIEALLVNYMNHERKKQEEKCYKECPSELIESWPNRKKLDEKISFD